MKDDQDKHTYEMPYRGEIGSYNDILNNPEFYTKEQFKKAYDWAYGKKIKSGLLSDFYQGHATYHIAMFETKMGMCLVEKCHQTKGENHGTY